MQTKMNIKVLFEENGIKISDMVFRIHPFAFGLYNVNPDNTGRIFLKRCGHFCWRGETNGGYCCECKNSELCKVCKLR